MSGLQGSGKNDALRQAGNFLKSKSRNSLLVACDVYRPAAIDQLKVLGEQISARLQRARQSGPHYHCAERYPVREGLNRNVVVIIDTAGSPGDRRRRDDGRIARIKSAIQPNEILFVVDSMTGQDAVNTAKAFNDRLDFNGVVLTKLDGDTRGGAALHQVCRQ